MVNVQLWLWADLVKCTSSTSLCRASQMFEASQHSKQPIRNATGGRHAFAMPPNIWPNFLSVMA